MYTAKDYTHLLGLPGFSDTMLTNHFTLYKGYVDNANKLIAKLNLESVDAYDYGELKRRLGWEVNGVKLHEMYFENITKEKTQASGAILEKITSTFESIENYNASLLKNGTIRGIGWVLLVQDDQTGEIYNVFVGDHNIGNIINSKILLVMDCWEHAYMTDYGIKRADYINAFMGAIDWSIVQKRFEK